MEESLISAPQIGALLAVIVLAAVLVLAVCCNPRSEPTVILRASPEPRAKKPHVTLGRFTDPLHWDWERRRRKWVCVGGARTGWGSTPREAWMNYAQQRDDDLRLSKSRDRVSAAERMEGGA